MEFSGLNVKTDPCIFTLQKDPFPQRSFVPLTVNKGKSNEVLCPHDLKITHAKLLSLQPARISQSKVAD